MYTFVWFSGAIWETPSKKTAVILSHLYVIGVKIVLRDYLTLLDSEWPKLPLSAIGLKRSLTSPELRIIYILY